jgi:hypothetical protein
MIENVNCGSGSYLFACFGGDLICSPATVFGRINDDSLIPSLIALLEKEYGGEGNPSFHAQPVTDTEEADQILLDEAIDELAIYDDPDPGIYDPPPSRQTMLRAFYAQRTEKWTEMLLSRKSKTSTSPNTNGSPLSDDVLLQICRTPTDDERVTAEWMADLRLMASLVDASRNSNRIGLEHAVTLLAGCIGQLPQYNPTHLPFGYSGPTIKSHHWMDHDALEQIAKQIVGLIWHDVDPDVVASDVTRCVSEAIRLGFIEQQEYDAWRPGMRSGSGWRTAVTATPYGMTKARTFFEVATPPEDKESDQTPVRQLAAALKELRLATGELLICSEKEDIYPDMEIMTYHQALRDAESRVDGIGAHLAYGREKPGQIETDLRETLHNLSSAVGYVASDYNDQPGAYPLPKEITAPGWEALKGLRPLEMVLAMTTMKPGDLEMPVEDRRVSGLILLMLLAQAYYKMLECVISMASWCSALDVELNQSYLWVTSSLTNLLKNHEDLKDFPVEFKSIFDDLYPSTVRDLEWEDMVAPEVERFLSTVQRYVHENGVYEPEEGSTAWTFVQLFRPSVDTAISRALDYHKRMRQYAQKAFAGISAGGSIQAGGAINAAGEINAGGEFAAGGDVRAGSPSPATPLTKPSGTTVAANPIASKDSTYEWARQTELVRATDQVLGQGTLSPGVLSRACGHQIETNGKRGQGSRVKVRSFLPWVTRKFNLAKGEQTQIRNAIIGEINERNS